MLSFYLFNLGLYFSFILYFVYSLTWYTLKNIYQSLLPHQPTVYILRGLPGSGKTSWCIDFISENGLTNHDQCIYLSTYKRQYHPKTLVNKTSSEMDAIRYDEHKCLKEFIWACQKQIPYILIDDCHCKLWELSNYHLLAKLYGFKVVQITINPKNKYLNELYFNRSTLPPTQSHFDYLSKHFEMNSDDIVIEPYIEQYEGDSLPFPNKTIEELDDELDEMQETRKLYLARIKK